MIQMVVVVGKKTDKWAPSANGSSHFWWL